jgi:hypothetical protein
MRLIGLIAGYLAGHGGMLLVLRSPTESRKAGARVAAVTATILRVNHKAALFDGRWPRRRRTLTVSRLKQLGLDLASNDNDRSGKLQASWSVCRIGHSK